MKNLTPFIYLCVIFMLLSCASSENAETDGDLETGEQAEIDDDNDIRQIKYCETNPIGEKAAYQESLVFVGLVDGYPVFRIPSIVTTEKGTLVAFAEARQTVDDPGHGEIDLVMKKSTDCGKTWSKLKVLAENGTGDAHNPAALVAPNKSGKSAIWLFFNKRPKSAGGEFDLPAGLDEKSASVWFITSEDEGETWSEATNITKSVKNPEWAIMSMGPGIGISTNWGNDKTPENRMLLPGWYTFGEKSKAGGSFVFYSDDFGENFKLGGLPEAMTNESQVVEITNGNILFDCRQNSKTDTGFRYEYTSNDGGMTWSEHKKGIQITKIMTSIIRYSAKQNGDEKDILLHSGVDKDGRFDLRIWMSFDEAKTWTNEVIIKKGFAQYSVLTVLPDKSIGIVYETMEMEVEKVPLSIRFARMNMPYLLENGK